MSDTQKPKIFTILKIVGFICIPVAIVGFILSASNFGNFDNNLFMVGGIVGALSFVLGVNCLIFGFLPEIKKVGVKTVKYLQEENKEDLTDLASTAADITKDAVTKTTKAVREGWVGTEYCKYCGQKIDADSRFCKHCGKEL